MGDPVDEDDLAAQIQAFQRAWARLGEQIRKVIVGHDEAIDQVMTCLLAGGHALLEGVPGLGKTLLVRTLADALELSFSRIQFTPDLMPTDITGTHILVSDSTGVKGFRFQHGPIFANLVLADEINRATPKTQSALLEAMQEQTVSIVRTTHPLPAPFLVLATQNPLEMEGTYPLPEAQLDRFMFKIHVHSPDVEGLVRIMNRTTGSDQPTVEAAVDGAAILRMRNLVREVATASHVKEYIARLVRATHPDGEQAPATAKKYVRYGASPRGAQAIILGAKVRALQAGRDNVAFSDVRAVAPAALRHRLILSFEGLSGGIHADEIIKDVLQSVPRAETV